MRIVLLSGLVALSGCHLVAAHRAQEPDGATAAVTAADTAERDAAVDGAPLDAANDGYRYRRPLIIDELAVGPLPAGYSVKVELDTLSEVSAGTMQPGGDDLRVIRHAGAATEELDRRLIAFNSTRTEIWFKTRAPIDGSNAEHYLYYGDPTASDPPAYWSDSMGADEPSRVYLAADDFQEHELESCPDGWGDCGTYWRVRGSGGERYLHSDGSNKYLFAGDAAWTDIMLEAKVKADDFSGCPGIATRVHDVLTLVYAGYDCIYSQQPTLMPARNAAVWVRPSTSGYYPLFWKELTAGPSWSTIAVAWSGQTVHLFHEGLHLGSDETVSADVKPDGRVGFFSTYGKTLYADDVVVRLFVDPEPTVTLGEPELLY